jgi:ATP-binding cassette subfamily C protein
MSFKSPKSPWLQILRMLTPRDRWVLLGIFVMMLAGAMFEAGGISAVPAFIAVLQSPDRVLEYEAGAWLYEALEFEDTRSFVFWFGVFLLAFFFVKNAYLALLTYVRVSFIRNLGVVFANRLFRSYLYAPYPFIMGTNSAYLQRNVNGECGKMIGSVLMPGLKLVMEITVTLAIIGVLLYAEPVLTLLLMGLLTTIGAGFNAVISRKLRRYSREQQRVRGQNVQYIQQGLGSLVDSRVLGRTEYFADAHRRTMVRYSKTLAYSSLVADFPSRIYETIMVFGILMIGLVFYTEGRGGDDLLPTLALFGFASLRLIPAASKITSSLTGLRFFYPSAEVVYRDIQRFEANTPSREEARRLPPPLPFEQELRLDHVSYRYPEAQRNAIDDVSLSIEPGQAIGIVGSSGAGKSTLASLLLGLLDTSEGAIYVDGRPLGQNLAGWRRNIGYVSQQVYLCEGSLRSNIALGVDEQEVDDDAVWHALDLAQLKGFVESLPEGLDSNVGEAGVRLSGGQRQRIAIARALYPDPKVLIFDEATAALDNQTEQGLIGAIERLRGERTVITVAHRLSTVRDSDRLFVFSDGKLVDQGTYDELLDSSPAFQAIAMHA